MISTFAGTGEAGNSGDGGPAIEAALARPTSPAFDEGGNLYFVNHNTETVRKIDTEGIISTVAGRAEQGLRGAGRRQRPCARGAAG